MPSLNIQLPGLPPVSHVLKDETITIGRMKGNTIVIEDSSISLMHAKITRKDGDYYLKDLNSTNGTILNGQPLGEARLHDLDRVRFAGIPAQYMAETPAPSSVPTPQALQAAALAPQSGPPGPAVLAPAPVPAAAAISTTAPLLKVAGSALPPLTSPHVHSPTTTVLAKRTLKNKNITRALAVAAVAFVVVAGLVGWMVFQGRQQQANKLGSRAPSPQTATRPGNSDGVSQRSAPKTTAPTARPVLETDSLPPAPAIAQWAKALKSADPAERRQAATSLHSAGAEAKSATPALREALKDSDPDVQLWSALALVNTQTYDKAVIPILVRSLQNSNPVVRQVACLSLGLIPYEGSDKNAVVPPLAEVAGKDSDNDVRQAAKSALSIVAPELYDTASSK